MVEHAKIQAAPMRMTISKNTGGKDMVYMRSETWVKGVLVALAAALLVGCGGGGGASSGSTDTYPPPGAPPPPPGPPSLDISESQVSVSAVTGTAAPASVDIKITVANAPPTMLTMIVTSSEDSVAAASATWKSNSYGDLTISFAPPVQVGNYTPTVTVNVCTDTACAHPISGSPAQVFVHYSITGSTPPPVSFYFPQPGVDFQVTTSDTSPETANFDFYIKNVPPAGLYVQITQPENGFVQRVSDTVEPDSSGQLDVALILSLVSPASLGSGFFNSSVTVAICYDQACSNPVAGSPVSVPIEYEVYLTQGKEYSLVSSSVGGISDLAYEASRGSLYVTGLAGYDNSIYSSAVTEVNPATGNSVTQLALGDGLSQIAVSDDGQYLYAASTTNSSIYRLVLPALTKDITIDLASASGGEGMEPNLAGGMAVAPGAPHTLAVALAHSSGSDQSQGVAIFDDGTERVQTLAPLGSYTSADRITWGANAGTLYASRESDQQPEDLEIDNLNVDPSGVTLVSSVNLTGTADTGGTLVYASGKLYESTGFVRDATSLSILDQLTLPAVLGSPTGILCLTPDVGNNRLFVLSSDIHTSHLILLSYTLPALTLQGAIDLGFDGFDVAIRTHLILWGSQGIAFNRNGLQILSGTFSAPGTLSTTPRAAARARLATRQPLRSFFIAGRAQPVR